MHPYIPYCARAVLLNDEHLPVFVLMCPCAIIIILHTLGSVDRIEQQVSEEVAKTCLAWCSVSHEPSHASSVILVAVQGQPGASHEQQSPM